MPFAEDLAPFFSAAEFASAVVWGAQTANGIIDQASDDIMGGRAIGQDIELTLPAASLPNIARGASITVDGTAWLVREVRLLDDGALKRLMLGRP